MKSIFRTETLTATSTNTGNAKIADNDPSSNDGCDYGPITADEVIEAMDFLFFIFKYSLRTFGPLVGTWYASQSSRGRVS